MLLQCLCFPAHLYNLHLSIVDRSVNLFVLGEPRPCPLLSLANGELGTVLLHNMHIGVLGNALSHPIHYLLRLCGKKKIEKSKIDALCQAHDRNEMNKIAEPTFNVVWHDEMSQQHTLFGQSPFIEAEVSNLSVHFLDDPSGDFRVVPGLAQPLTGLTGPKLEVRHINVNKTIKQLQKKHKLQILTKNVP